MPIAIKSKLQASEIFLLVLLAAISAAPSCCCQISKDSAANQEINQTTIENLLTAQINTALEKADQADQQDKPAIAERYFRTALDLARQSTVNRTQKTHAVLLRYADFLYCRRLYLEAMGVYNEAEELAGLRIRPFIRFAQSAYCCGETKLALELFKSVYESDRKHGNAEGMWPNTVDGERNALAYLYILHGKTKEADELYATENQSNFEDQEKYGRRETFLPRRNQLLRDRAAQYLKAHDTKKATGILRSALDLMENSLPKLSPAVDSTRQGLADAYLEAKQSKLAEKLYLDLLKKYKNTPDEDNSHTQAARYYWQANQPAKTVKHLRQALALRLRRYKADDKMVISVQKNLVLALQASNQFKQAERLNATIAKHETNSPADDYGALYRKAQRLAETGNKIGAIRLFENKIADTELQRSKAKAGEDGQYMNDLNQMSTELAELYYAVGDYDKTQKILEKKYYQYEKTCSGTPDMLVHFYLKRGKVQEAEKLLVARIDQFEKNLREQKDGKDGYFTCYLHPWEELTQAKTDLAYFYFKRKQFKQAELILEPQLKLLDQADLSNRASTNILAGNLASLYAIEGQTAEAIKLQKERQRIINCTYGESCMQDPVFGFNSTGGGFTSDGPDENKYLNAAREERLDPSLNPYMHSSPSITTPKRYLDNYSSDYHNSIAMAEFVDRPMASLVELSAAGKLALSSLYRKQGDNRAALEIDSDLFYQIDSTLFKPHVFSLAYSMPYDTFHNILTRLPSSPQRNKVLARVDKEKRLASMD